MGRDEADGAARTVRGAVMAGHGTPAARPPWWRFLPALASLAGLAAVVWIAAPGLPRGGLVAEIPWLPALGIAASLRLDGLSLAFALLVTGVGALVHLYAAAYFARDPRLWRLMLLLGLFELSMLGLVLADDLITLFVFWEGTTITSWLLVGFDHHKAEARAKALQALMVTGAGGLALLAGLVLLGDAAGTMRLSGWAEAGETLRDAPHYGAMLALVLAGCFTKSAQIPFHFWLPNAMAAPTPVSAYLHSATMVKAGVYLLARLSPALGGTEAWLWTLTLTGGLTMLLGAVWAIRQTDLKLMLAYTTVSGLGSLVMFLGSTAPVAVVAASTFLIVHAFYKAALFLTVGILDKQAGTREIGALGGLGRRMPVTWAVALLAGFAMAGFPPLLGFIGKELKYEGALAVASEPLFVAGIAVVSNALMVVVGLVLAMVPFRGALKAARPDPVEAPWPMLAGPVVLALGGLAFGLSPGLIERTLVQPMATAILGAPVRVELKLWHGVNVPVALSFVTFGLGLAAHALLPRLRAGLAAAEAVLPRAEAGYDRCLAGLKAGAAAVARTVQPGRLSAYLGASLGTMAALLLGAALLGTKRGAVAWSVPSLIEAGVLLFIAAGAVALPFARSRLMAVGALAVVGSGTALVFALYGAVDVAMTQLLVETLLAVVIAVALLRLPLPVAARPSGPGRALIAAAAGAGVTLALLAVLGTPLDRSLTDFFERASWTEAYGRNIVNVILVDFRALDTFGEMIVVAIAAIGVLAVLGRRRGDA